MINYRFTVMVKLKKSRFIKQIILNKYFMARLYVMS